MDKLNNDDKYYISNSEELNKEIKLTNPDNLINLIHIDKLIEYIDRFVNSSKNSSIYTSKYSISVGNLEKLLKKC